MDSKKNTKVPLAAPSIINDAVHGVMYLPGEYKTLIKKIIDHKLFQRLRHIKQLGMAELVFPTAVHNRFSHCIGTAYLAYRIADKLKLDDDQKKHVIAGALLHDIGHGPFSHTFEELFKEKGKKRISHEDWTPYFLKDFEKLLVDNGIDFDVISSLIKKDNKKEQYNIIADIISSQLDADRLDYLLRDSHFCGVPYGKIDLDWIINNLIKIDETKSPPKLGIHRKGWRAVEHFLICRRTMTQNIYFHPKVKALEQLFIFFLRKISEFAKEDGKLIKNENLRSFLKNAGQYIIDGEKNKFINDNYSYYSSLTDYDLWMLIRDTQENGDKNNDIYKISENIYSRKVPRLYYLRESSKDAVESIIDELRENNMFKNWEVFLTNNKIKPYDSKDGKIFIFDENSNRVNDIPEYSRILDILNEKYESEICLAIDVNMDENKRKSIIDKLKKYVDFKDE